MTRVLASHAMTAPMLTVVSLLLLLLMPACVARATSDAEVTLTCGDAPSDTPLQDCIVQNLALRDQTLRSTIDTIVGHGVARVRLDTINQQWRGRGPPRDQERGAGSGGTTTNARVRLSPKHRCYRDWNPTARGCIAA